MDPTLPAAATIIPGHCSHHVAHISLSSSQKQKKKYNNLQEKQRGSGPKILELASGIVASSVSVFWLYFKEMGIKCAFNVVFVKCPT